MISDRRGLKEMVALVYEDSLGRKELITSKFQDLKSEYELAPYQCVPQVVLLQYQPMAEKKIKEVVWRVMVWIVLWKAVPGLVLTNFRRISVG